MVTADGSRHSRSSGAKPCCTNLTPYTQRVPKVYRMTIMKVLALQSNECRTCLEGRALSTEASMWGSI